MLPRPLRQESLSKAYVRAIAAKAGLICVQSEYDFGIDLSLRTIQESDGHLTDTGFQVDMQIKSSTRANIARKMITLDLAVKN
jgi:Domain of unknown function (DUF4365)